MMLTLLPRLGLLSLFCLLAAARHSRTATGASTSRATVCSRKARSRLRQGAAAAVGPAALIPPLECRRQFRCQWPALRCGRQRYAGPRIFLSLMDNAAAEPAGTPAVTGNITFSLRNDVGEVLAAVRDSYGYDYRRTSYGYQIRANTSVTRTYDLNYLNLQRQGMSDTRVSSGRVTTSDNTGTGASGTTTSTTSSTVNASQLLTSSNVDFWSEVREVVAMMIGSEVGNSVVVNPQAGLLVVRASSADQQNVERFLQQAQRKRQVILETKIRR